MAIQLAPLNLKQIIFEIVGTSPMIQHSWSEKGRQQLRMTATERRKIKKTSREPKAESHAATYFTEEGKYGIPAMAFKSALITAAHKDIGLEKTMVRKSLFIICNDANGVLEIECDEPRTREDIVRVGAGSADLRYRPEFPAGWRCRIEAQLDYDWLNETNLANLVNRAGFGSGIGEMRPEKGGDSGRFKINTAFPMQIED